MNSTILQQVFVVEYVVQSQLCDACHRRAAQDFWKATVQVRQKVCHRMNDHFSGRHDNALTVLFN